MQKQYRHSIVAACAAIVALALPASAAAVPTITTVAPASVVAGAKATVTGTVTPAGAADQVRLEQNLDGAWVQAGAVATTTAAGAWSVAFAPSRSGAIRAVQLTGDLTTSAEATVAVQPRVMSAKLAAGRVYPFLGTRATWKVAPAAAYPNGTKVRIAMSLGGKAAGTVTARIANGVVSAKLPSNGVGRFRARLDLPQVPNYAATSNAQVTFVVAGQRVASGSSSTWVRSLRAGLVFRGFHVPGGSRFDSRYGDSVIAFHKAYGRARTTSFEASDWKILTQKRIAPRDPSKALHIEIDKSRQILMLFKGGKAIKIVHVSTGSTGNTPVGRHKIQWKGNWVPSLYGSLLWKSMAFRGAFAIHGYPSVPTQAASHGCVRVPMWIAGALYAASPVGTPVIVYAGPGSNPTSIGRGSAKADKPELTGIDASVYASEA
ncbi:MAG: hypothetical protein JWM90_885 [Thermoleophilia bacterium]|nr:hypothetical protein [Thermoleophilia bacterium]